MSLKINLRRRLEPVAGGPGEGAAGHDLPGWRDSPTLVALTSRAAEFGLWGLVVAGPVLGVIALVGDAEAELPTLVQVSEPIASGVGPAGVAALYVDAWLAAGDGADELARAVFPDLAPIDREPGTYSASQIAPIAVDQLSPGYWAVTVAAHVAANTEEGSEDLGIRYYQVGIRATGGPTVGGGDDPSFPVGYSATGLPAEVNPPSTLAETDLAYVERNSTDAQDPIASAVTQFLSAYLLGDRELARYIAPNAPITPLSPPPYLALELRALHATDVRGSEVSVLATVTVQDARHLPSQLTYPLTLASRDGRWEVSAIDPAPLLPGGLSAPAEMTPATEN